MEPAAYLDSLRPAGSKRSSKRDLIVNVFLRQEGHLTAEDLVELIRREESSRTDLSSPPSRMSRATVYRTLQWMVVAGIARKVDCCFAGPQSVRLAQAVEDGKLEIGAIHTYVEL